MYGKQNNVVWIYIQYVSLSWVKLGQVILLLVLKMQKDCHINMIERTQ